MKLYRMVAALALAAASVTASDRLDAERAIGSVREQIEARAAVRTAAVGRDKAAAKARVALMRAENRLRGGDPAGALKQVRKAEAALAKGAEVTK